MRKSTLDAESGPEAGVRALSRADVPVKATCCYFKIQFIEMSKLVIYLVLVVRVQPCSLHIENNFVCRQVTSICLSCGHNEKEGKLIQGE